MKQTLLTHLLQGIPRYSCLLACRYSVMTGLSLCVGVTERLTSDSLHVGYTRRSFWFVEKERCTIEWQITIAQKE